MPGRRPTEARIRLGALRANFAEVRRRAAGADVMAVVKADAYGHGAAPVTAALAAAGCRRFAVLTVGEAVALRDAGRREEIVAMGGVHDPEEAALAAAREVVPVVHHAGHLKLLAGAARQAPLPVHVEVDTGMHRMGVPDAEAPELLARVAAEPGLRLAGVYTHLARADEPDLEPTREQLRRFGRVLAETHARGIDPGLVHFANSAGLLAGGELAAVAPAADAVRVGLALYGAQPSGRPPEGAGPPPDASPGSAGRHGDAEPRATQGGARGETRTAALRPVMTLVSRVATVRSLRPGDEVGYGGEFRARRPTRVATLDVGYGDGYLRSAGGRAEVWLAGARRPVVGRVSMDFIGVDVGDAPVEVGDEAVVFGAEGEARMPVEDVAAAAGTIPYEVMVRVGPRVPRVYLDDGSAD